MKVNFLPKFRFSDTVKKRDRKNLYAQMQLS